MKKLLFVIVAGMFLLSAGFGVFLRPLLYTLTPLQRYYLGAYLASSWHEKDPSAMSEVQWIWKVKPAAGLKKSQPHLQYSLATEDDLFPIPARELLWKGDILPFWMNRKAELDGWTGVERGLPTEVNSAKLAGLLREEFFYGEPVSHYFLQPALLLVAALLLWSRILSWRSARRERYLWGKPVPLWRELGQNVLSLGAGFRKSVQARRALRASAPKPLIEVRPLAKPATTQKTTSAATAQTALPPPQTPAAKSNGFAGSWRSRLPPFQRRGRHPAGFSRPSSGEEKAVIHTEFCGAKCLHSSCTAEISPVSLLCISIVRNDVHPSGMTDRRATSKAVGGGLLDGEFGSVAVAGDDGIFEGIALLVLHF